MQAIASTIIPAPTPMRYSESILPLSNSIRWRRIAATWGFSPVAVPLSADTPRWNSLPPVPIAERLIRSVSAAFSNVAPRDAIPYRPGEIHDATSLLRLDLQPWLVGYTTTPRITHAIESVSHQELLHEIPGENTNTLRFLGDNKHHLTSAIPWNSWGNQKCPLPNSSRYTPHYPSDVAYPIFQDYPKRQSQVPKSSILGRLLRELRDAVGSFIHLLRFYRSNQQR